MEGRLWYRRAIDTVSEWSLIEKFIALTIALVVVMVFVQPYFEMRAFNRHRKPGTPEATYFDAMFGELRIMNQ